jgi:hypothetical protein
MNRGTAVELLINAAVKYEKSAASMGQTFSNWPEYQIEKAKECREAAQFLIENFHKSEQDNSYPKWINDPYSAEKDIK